MSGYSVRPMQLPDAGSVAEVHVRVWRDTYPGLMSAAYLDALDVAEFVQSWSERLADVPADTSYLVGLAPDVEVVGLGVAGPSRDDDPPVPRELYAINVLATAQGTGLANQLMAELLAAIRGHGTEPEQVTDVVLSHHHPDHTVNIALFPNARVHDHWAVYDGDLWTSRDADGVQLSESVRLLRTPGHTNEDISTLVDTADGVLAFTHAWWRPDGPVTDPYAPDAAVLAASRQLLLAAADTIVPGHGPAFPAAEALT